MVKVFILRIIGNFLVLSAITGIFLTFYPAISAEVGYRYRQYASQKYVLAETPAAVEQAKNAKPAFNLLSVDIPSELPLVPVSVDFSVVIPKIGANSIVVPNVHPGKQDEYFAALKKGVAHALGTVYPGQIGNSFLFAHSVRNFWEVNQWNAIFYLLKELVPGDEVDLFYQGRRYIYLVYDKKIVEPSETGYLFLKPDFPMLTMQTCWPPGTTLKRLLVFARLKGS